MKVYLVRKMDEWTGVSELDKAYVTQEKAVKRVAENILREWDESLDEMLREYNKAYNTNYTKEEFAYDTAKDGGHGDISWWFEVEAE